MNSRLNLGVLTEDSLAELTCHQLRNLIPDGRTISIKTVRSHLGEALHRLQTCINGIRTWEPDRFNYLHSSQYCTYLYYLANTIWRNNPAHAELCTRLFLLNKSLNAIDLYFEIPMSEVFFIGHSVGIVLTKTHYGNYFAIYQNSTIGKNHGIAPTLSDGLLMYPNTAIIGRSIVGPNTVVAAGTTILNTDVEGNSIVYGSGRKLVLKPAKRPILSDVFRL